MYPKKKILMTKQKLFQETIKPQDFDKIIKKLRGFFMQKGYIETFPQPRLSILAACEDPKTVKSYEFNGEIWLRKCFNVSFLHKKSP